MIGSELKRIFDVRKRRHRRRRRSTTTSRCCWSSIRATSRRTAEYAIDQFVLRGGKLIAFVDPYAYFDQQPDLQNPFGGTQAGQSSLYTLFKAWGMEPDVEPGRRRPHLRERRGAAAAADAALAQPGGAQPGRRGDEPGGNAARCRSAARSRASPPRGSRRRCSRTPRRTRCRSISSSPRCPASRRRAASSLRARNIRSRMRLTGKFKSAFPERPAAAHVRAPRTRRKTSRRKTPQPARSTCGKARGENQVVLVADVDMLSDGAAVEVQDDLRAEAHRAAQRQPRVRAGPGRAVLGRSEPHEPAQPRVVHAAAHGDPEMEGAAQQQATSARSRSSRTTSTRRRRSCRTCRKAKARRRARRSSRRNSRPRSTTSARRRWRRARI